MVRRTSFFLLIVVFTTMLMATASHAQTPPGGHPGPGGYDTPPTQAFEEFTIRLEPDLGSPRCPVDQANADHCDPVRWLSTRSQNFVNIMGDAYIRGGSGAPQGVQMTSSFVASQNDTNVAIQFSAEAYVRDDNAGANRRMFVRALVDGAVVSPSDVVFATTSHQGTQSFIFTTNVGAGIHTVEIQWKMDTQATGYLRDASLLVRMGRDEQSEKGTFTTKTAPSGANQVTNQNAWTDVPGMFASVYSPKSGMVTASFSAEAYVSKGKRFALRAIIDGAPMNPGDVVFVNNNPHPSSQAMTFGLKNVAAGWHTVKIQWLVDAGGTATVGDRSLAVSALPVRTDAGAHQFLAAASGANVYTPKEVSTPVELPGMSVKFDVGAKGNGEVAVQFSAEIGATSDADAFVGLAIDGQLVDDNWVLATDGTQSAQAKSFVFEAKGIEPGSHTATIYFGSGSEKGQAYAGDRTMNLMTETGFIPDLAEAPKFGGGHIGKDSDYIAGIEPLIGSRKVLTVLIDPGLCSGTIDQVAQQMCYNQFTLPKGKVDQAVFGTSAEPGWGAFNGNNIKSYLETQSGGRYTIERAGPGIAGWYTASKPSDAYFKHDGSCTDGFDEGMLMLLAEAVKKSNPAVNFASFDTDGDGTLSQQELGILVVIPRATGGAGSSIQPLLASNCGGPSTRLSLDGVVLPQYVAKWNANFDATVEPNQFMTGAHEYLHLVGGADDLYLDFDVSTFPRDMTIMSNGEFSTTHLDPLYKLAFGWLTPVIVDETKQVTVSAVAKSNTVYILPRYNNPWGEEYFILENRKANMGLPWFDQDINDSGIGVWHIVSDREENQFAPIGTPQATWDDSHIPDDNPTSQGQMGRNGIRLIRPFDDVDDEGNAMFDDKSHTLWTKLDYNLESGSCILIIPSGEAFKNKLAWADCEKSGYSLSFQDFAIENLKVNVKVD